MNFNYTEFLETLYNIPLDQIKYIHGCRKSVKGVRKEELILGHKEIEYYDDFDIDEMLNEINRDEWETELLLQAIENTAMQWEHYYEEAFTKQSDSIIKNNAEFFEKIIQMKDIVVIGHSLSEVDYPYFREIVEKNSKHGFWHICYYTLNDLRNIKKFVERMGIDASQYELIKL